MIHPAVLPIDVRQGYRPAYEKLIQDYNLLESVVDDYNESDSNQYRRIIKNQIEQTLALLDSPAHDEVNLQNLVAHCKKWDLIHGYNAIELYPELADIFRHHGY
jgi:hypothetical protein